MTAWDWTSGRAAAALSAAWPRRRPSALARWGGLAAGAGAGAALMYVLDPRQGRTRRAKARDKMDHVAHEGRWALQGMSADLAHRSRGLLAGLFAPGRPKEVPADVLVARVRSRLGRLVGWPHAIQVQAREGHVTLSGPVGREVRDRLLRAVARVKGVHSIVDRLDVQPAADILPGGQTTARPVRRGRRNLTPAARLLSESAGGALLATGAALRGWPGALALLVGTGLLVGGAAGWKPVPPAAPA